MICTILIRILIALFHYWKNPISPVLSSVSSAQKCSLSTFPRETDEAKWLAGCPIIFLNPAIFWGICDILPGCCNILIPVIYKMRSDLEIIAWHHVRKSNLQPWKSSVEHSICIFKHSSQDRTECNYRLYSAHKHLDWTVFPFTYDICTSFFFYFFFFWKI